MKTGAKNFENHKSSSKGKEKEGPVEEKEGSVEKKEGHVGENSRTPPWLEELQDEDFDPTPFAFKPIQLARMLDPKNFDTLTTLGGITGLMRGLGSNSDCGLSDVASATLTRTSSDLPVPERYRTQEHPAYGATFDDRRRVFGENRLPQRFRKSLIHFMWLTMKDKLWILLFISAIISLALGLFQDSGIPRDPNQPQVDWVEGAAIVVAIIIVAFLGSLIDWHTARQLEELDKRKDERVMKVIRDGQEKVIDIKEALVGDIALLEPGDIVPCDGIFLSGHNVRCDESEISGEPDIIRKVSYDEVLELKKTRNEAHADCFVLSGSKVLEGVGEYVVVAVGLKSFNGRIMNALQEDFEAAPLQIKLNHLAEMIAKIGTAAGLLLFVALMVRFFVQLGTGNPHRSPNENGTAFINILTTSIILIVIAVPEGLPLALSFAFAFAAKRMAHEQLLVRAQSSYEKMAYASVICTDRTGILTRNSMTVVAGTIGIRAKFVRDPDKSVMHLKSFEDEKAQEHPENFFFDWTKFNNIIPPKLQEILNEAIAINSTAFEDVDPDTGDLVFIGNKVESALLQFAKNLQWRSFREVRESAEIVQKMPFSSEQMAMGVVVRLLDGTYRFYVKGAFEILVNKCSHHVVVSKDGSSGSSGLVQTRLMDADALDSIPHTIASLASQPLRFMALCYKDIRSWSFVVPTGLVPSEQTEMPFRELMQDLTLIGIVGIEDPLRPGIRESIAKCNLAGITVKMCTGDGMFNSRSIARQCGIFTPGGIVIEGPVFRQLTQTERVEIVPRLQVLARSSAEDKKILVDTLKSLGETVCVTGSRTIDGPALKTADVGFSMGIAGTEAAKEASDIILMDDNFSTVVKAIIWGRCICDSVRKLLQFQITASITAVVITFVTALASELEESVLTPVQLLWINIIMDTFAALALATDPATEWFLKRKPEWRNVPLLSTDMYKMIVFQCIYQIVIILVFHFLGDRILGYDRSASSNAIMQTFLFNTFVFAQLFNCINCRRPDGHLNVFEGIHRNYYIIGVTLIEMGIQTLIIFVGGAALEVTAIPGREWGISLALGFVSLPLGSLVRSLPSRPFEKFFQILGLIKREDILPSTRPDRETLPDPINVRDNLKFMENIRGGRMHSSPFLDDSRSARLKKEATRLPRLLTLTPSILAGKLFRPDDKHTQDSSLDPTHLSPVSSWNGKTSYPHSTRLHLHPDTPKDDPAFIRYGGSP